MMDSLISRYSRANLGLTFQEAFENLCARVPSTDLRFFVIAILIQRETGGNIAEVLDNISRLMKIADIIRA